MHEPTELPMFPLSTVVFPFAQLPLHVFELRYQQLVVDVMEGDRTFGIVLIDRGPEVGGGEHRVDIGTRVEVEHLAPIGEGRSLLVARATERIKVVQWLDDAPYPRALVVDHPQHDVALDEAQLHGALSAVRRSRALLSEVHDAPALCGGLDLGDDHLDAAWMLCALAPIGMFDAQSLLEIDDPRGRLELLTVLSDAVAETALQLLASGQEPTLS